MSALVARSKTAGGVGEVGRAGRRLRRHPPPPTAGLTQSSGLGRRLWVRVEVARTPATQLLAPPGVPEHRVPLGWFLEMPGPRQEHKAKSHPEKLACWVGEPRGPSPAPP